jgi:hypothetical protein
MNLPARTKHLKLEGLTKTQLGKEMRNYMDMSVCVAAQPVGWFWNIGKLLSMLAYTLGDHVNAKYPDDQFKGVTTTSLYGGSGLTQYSGVYEYLGETKGHGHEHVDDEQYGKMLSWMRERCPHCSPGCDSPLIKQACNCKECRELAGLTEGLITKHESCVVPATRDGSGANGRMRRIAAYRKHSKDTTISLTHGHKRGIYYHDAVDSSKRDEVIQEWYEKWGYPRYRQTLRKLKKGILPPYMDGKTGGKKYE